MAQQQQKIDTPDQPLKHVSLYIYECTAIKRALETEIQSIRRAITKHQGTPIGEAYKTMLGQYLELQNKFI